jgi:hypothetical protein
MADRAGVADSARNDVGRRPLPNVGWRSRCSQGEPRPREADERGSRPAELGDAAVPAVLRFDSAAGALLMEAIEHDPGRVGDVPLAGSCRSAAHRAPQSARADLEHPPLRALTLQRPSEHDPSGEQAPRRASTEGGLERRHSGHRQRSSDEVVDRPNGTTWGPEPCMVDAFDVRPFGEGGRSP